MFQYVFSFDSLTAAQAARGVLDARYVPCRVVRAPKAAAKRGCGYAVRVEGRDGARSAALLREAGQRFSGVFRLLPDGTAEYTVNLLKGFVFRGWMDYLTFGRYGTGGWASPDGTINCVERAYDLESERFQVSLLKHEAQHTVDMKRFPGITPAELEYRAKLVELHYASDLGLLRKFLSEAEESRAGDSHAAASVRIRRDFADTDPGSLSRVQARALELLRAHTKEMEEKYGGQAPND